MWLRCNGGEVGVVGILGDEFVGVVTMRCSVPQNGATALIAAARSGHVDAMAVLLDRGADLEAKDNVRASALAIEQWRSPSLSDGSRLQSGDRALGLCWSQAGKAAVEWVKAEHLKALVQQILENARRAREREQARCAEALAAKQAEMEEALAAKQAEMEGAQARCAEALAAKQAELDAQAGAAQAYRTATVAAMAALEHRVKQLEDLAQLL